MQRPHTKTLQLILWGLLSIGLTACDGGDNTIGETDTSNASQSSRSANGNLSSSSSSSLCAGVSDVIEIDGQCVSLYCPATGGFVSHPDECDELTNNLSSSSASSMPVINADIICPEGYRPAPVENVSFFCVNTAPVSNFETSEQCPGGLSNSQYCFYPDGGTQSSSSSACPDGQTANQHGNCGYYENYCQIHGTHSQQCLQQCQQDESSDTRCDEVLANAQTDCPVDYNAMGNGSWQACYTLEDGTAECLHKDSGTQATQVTWDDGTPVTTAAQITGAGYYEVILVTKSGAVYYGDRSRLSQNNFVFAEGGVTATGGQNTMCAIIKDDGQNDVRCWGKDKDPYRPELPLDFNALQLSANYSDVCALNDDNSVWCWEQKPDNSLDFIEQSPTQMPFSEAITYVSVGQLVICGVKQSGGLECLARWSDVGYMPSKGDDTTTPVAQAGMEDVVAYQAGFGQAISIHADGKAKLWTGGAATEFTGISNAIAGGGDRGLACTLTDDGDVYCLNNGSIVKVNGDKKAAPAGCQ